MAFKEKKGSEKILDVDASMQGTLSFKDPVNLRINGTFEGNLDTKGTLTIGETAVVSAQIEGENIMIAGKVKGDILASQRVVLFPTGVLQGDIKTPRLNIVEGAVFEGNVHMLQDVLDITELSKYLEIENSSLLEWANNGKIPAFKDGNSWKFDRKKVDEWVASGKIR
ncbi:polymer-forming cytoskeletal protein [Candidatus Omnitrophota bacterium]